ncbi:MAG: gliding motility lipoprotein GldH [Chitinophagales bacterium]
MQVSPKVFVVSAVLLTLTLLTACDKARIIDENQPVTNYNWNYSDEKVFTTEIKDTAITYNLYVNVRHSFNFEWRNMWVNIETTFPDGKKFDKRVNLLLSEPDGHWFGDCLGDNCDIQIPIQENAYFPQPGKYVFKLRQDMRVNPLPNIKSMGMRIEKYTAKQ